MADSAPSWTALATADRCRVVARARHRIAAEAESLVRDVASPQRPDAWETWSAELIPLCDALLWIGRRGASVLRTRRLGAAGRPFWLWGVRSRVERVPRGVVLVIGAWNYPLLLAGVQVAQALAAGNRVLWKPAPGCERASASLADCFHRAGVPGEALRVLGSSPESAAREISEGVDLVVLTGSAETGRKVMARAADSLTPSIMELSGCDSLTVLQGADLGRAASAVRFGLLLNSGATCIAPRRILVARAVYEPFVDLLSLALQSVPPVTVHPAARDRISRAIAAALGEGATDLLRSFDAETFAASGQMRPVVLSGARETMAPMQEDLFGAVACLCEVEGAEQAAGIVNRCAYRLAASIFGPPPTALAMAEQLQVGVVTINDAIVPTADPRLPFGGRGNSGFGVTRGAEGLLEMTVPRVIAIRRGGVVPHLDPPPRGTLDILAGALQARHAESARLRLGGLRRLIRGVRLSQH